MFERRLDIAFQQKMISAQWVCGLLCSNEIESDPAGVIPGSCISGDSDYSGLR